MKELIKRLKEEFKDKETRHVYCDEFLNASIATQIKVLREQRNWTQSQLAERTGMKQSRIVVLEDVNYSSWNINVLRRLAEAYDLTLTIKFESFGEKLAAIESFSKEALEKPSFDDDPIFQDAGFIANEKVPLADVVYTFRTCSPSISFEDDEDFVNTFVVATKFESGEQTGAEVVSSIAIKSDFVM